MLTSVGRFECFGPLGESGPASSDEPAGCAASSRRTQQREKSKSLGITDSPVFQRGMARLAAAGVSPRYVEIRGLVAPLPWGGLPAAAAPGGGRVPASRVSRKTMQVENMVRLALQLCDTALGGGDSGDAVRVVEFCAGSGYIGLPLACMDPRVTVSLVDMKQRSLDIGAVRVQAAGLGGRARTVLSRIEQWDEPFQVGIALHACGGATDVTLEKCVAARAALVVCSCCIGKVMLQRTTAMSKRFRTCMSEGEYKHLIRAADFGHADIPNSAAINKERRLAKTYIEEDRRLWLEENGYEAYIGIMHPRGASPKNDVLFGWPREMAGGRAALEAAAGAQGAAIRNVAEYICTAAS